MSGEQPVPSNNGRIGGGIPSLSFLLRRCRRGGQQLKHDHCVVVGRHQLPSAQGHLLGSRKGGGEGEEEDREDSGA